MKCLKFVKHIPKYYHTTTSKQGQNINKTAQLQFLIFSFKNEKKLRKVKRHVLHKVTRLVLLKHGRQTPGPQAKSGPAPCFYPVAAPSCHLTVKELLHVYSPKVTFGPLKATVRLVWPPVKISLTPLV